MAQDGGVDPHNIAVAHGFLDRFRGRPESSCVFGGSGPNRTVDRGVAIRCLRRLATEPYGAQGEI